MYTTEQKRELDRLLRRFLCTLSDDDYLAMVRAERRIEREIGINPDAAMDRAYERQQRAACWDYADVTQPEGTA